MKNFTSVKDIPDLSKAVHTALEIKKTGLPISILEKIKPWF